VKTKIDIDGQGECLSPEDWVDSAQFWDGMLGPADRMDTEREEGVADPRAETDL
jgi:hypothetical protein